MNNKYFIITIDTEGDNLWDYKDGEVITTENVRFLSRFQDLCERYHFYPTWLTNYEMISDEKYVDFAKDVIRKETGEIGIHIHAWNNPPEYEMDNLYSGNPYLIEYPEEVMEEKFKVTYNLIYEKLGIKSLSHRAGRWAMNKSYFNLLNKYGLIADCSYTPGIDWSNCKGRSVSGGTNYTDAKHEVQLIGAILEVPMSIVYGKEYSFSSIKLFIKSLLGRRNLWMRPAMSSLHEMKFIVKEIEKKCNSNYIEFMLHSSELMPGGSPYFKSESQIEKLYRNLEDLFIYLKGKGYIGITLSDYAKMKMREMNKK